LYYAFNEGFGSELFWFYGVFGSEVSNGGTAEGGEIGAGFEGVGEVGDQGSYVGSAAARDVEGSVFAVEGKKLEGVDGDGPALALHGLAAAVSFVKALALHLDGGSHRWDLAYIAGEAPDRVAQGSFVGHWCILEGCEPAVRV
jgi:hypothetical protein